MKLGLLGTGMMVQYALTVLKDFDFEYMSILSTVNSLEKASEIAKYFNINKIHTDYDEMLRSEVDTIYVALPNHLHFEFAKKALLAGKHVIIEKPITANQRELDQLKIISNQLGLVMVEAMNVHHLPTYKHLKESLYKVGSIKVVSFNYSQYSSRYDAFKKGEILSAFDYTKAGGALMDINVYNIHGVIGLFGKPKRVNYMANIEKNIDTSGILTLDYGSFKAVCIGAKDCGAPVVLTIQGDLGNIRIYTPISGITSYEFVDNKGNIETYEEENFVHRLYYEFKEFVRIIEQKDFVAANKLMELSSLAVSIMTEARAQEGIVFTNDR